MTRALYFTYDGLLDPLGQSQVIPYILSLIAAGHSFTVISYEKGQRSTEETLTLERRLNEAHVEWVRLHFRAGKFQFVKRIISGILLLRKVCKRLSPDVVHLRGFMPALIYKLSLLRVPHLYDFRGFTVEEWADIGKVGPGTLAHQTLRKIDRNAVATACGLVVLEKSAESLLRKAYKVPNVPFKVIRTCTDVSLYKEVSGLRPKQDLIRFVYLGGARRPYRPDLALRLVSQLLEGGVDCRVDFINERDHAEILAAAEETCFPLDRMKILKLDQRNVPAALEEYDCGLVFLDTSPWRRVCSPTKLGEYLAAGLPVISLDGIDVLETFAANTSCVVIVKQNELLEGLGVATVERIISFIRQLGVGVTCQELARCECSLDMASRLYTELYAEIEARL